MFESSPKITVLMAVYNGEKTIQRAIESILSQTFPDFEFLIIDDCSNDETIDIIQSYHDKRVRLHRNIQNIGQTESLNVGIKLARAPYIARMDADDYSFPKRLEKQYDFLQENPDFAVVGTNCLVVNETGEKRSISRGCSRYEDIILKMLYGSSINHVSVLMRTEPIKKLDGYRSKFMIAADFDLWSRLVRNGYKITTIPKILTAYVYSDKSYSYRNKTNKYEELVEIIYENIQCFSSYPTSKEDVQCVARIFSDEFSELSDEDRSMGQILFKNIVQNLKPELNIKVNNRRINKILCNNYYLAAFHLILDKRREEARQITLRCILNYGLNLYLIVLFSLTYSGNNIAKKINFLRAKYF